MKVDKPVEERQPEIKTSAPLQPLRFKLKPPSAVSQPVSQPEPVARDPTPEKPTLKIKLSIGKKPNGAGND